MKKFYFLSAIALSTTFLTAQVIEQDNYDSYTLGDVGSNFAFGAPGQGGMYLSGGSAPDYQIVSIDAEHGKSLQIISGNTVTAASNRQVTKTGFGAVWGARNEGNDILRITFDFYTGTSTGTQLPGINVTNAAGGIVGLKYNTSTKLFQGQVNMAPTGGTAAFYNITGISTVQYPANTWVRVGLTYDKVNGTVTYKIGDADAVSVTVNGYTITKNLDGTQFNVVGQYTTGNNASTTFAIDNYKVEAVDIANMGVATVGQIDNKEVEISIYPNPVTDYINFKSSSRIISVSIIDVSGRTVTTEKVINNKMDTRKLAKGTYILKIETEDGTQSKKIIKK